MSNELLMTLDDVIKKRVKEDKSDKFRKLTQPRYKRANYRRRPQGSSTSQFKDTRLRLHIENLNKEMLNTDLSNLFGKYGKLKRCGIHFDKLGKSTGHADVEFTTHEECEAAIKELDHANVVGEEMRVKYASPIGRNNKFRRTRTEGSTLRRTVRKTNSRILRRKRPLSSMNRERRRLSRKTGLRTRRTALNRRRVNTSGTAGGAIKRRRRIFTKTLGRRRMAAKK